MVPVQGTATITFSASRRSPCDHSFLVVHSEPSNPSTTSTSVRVGDQSSGSSFVQFRQIPRFGDSLFVRVRQSESAPAKQSSGYSFDLFHGGMSIKSKRMLCFLSMVQARSGPTSFH
ncbi:uncharacterized protein LOC124657265 [Lolium rigidum]|uniref:uncharacterized protein LOC124657265 n=1 Tax=Lolium rigidum TaxID=89674 RepID=UPI001F5D614D|nr:uncharacterized protein LOC124657265 [Lolium rigidum]